MPDSAVPLLAWCPPWRPEEAGCLTPLCPGKYHSSSCYYGHVCLFKEETLPADSRASILKPAYTAGVLLSIAYIYNNQLGLTTGEREGLAQRNTQIIRPEVLVIKSHGFGEPPFSSFQSR